MAIDWGGVIGGALGGLAGQLGGPSAHNPFVAVSPAGGLTVGAQKAARKVTVDTVTGEVHACRRRRRRRLLTPTDLSDLAALAAVVGKGDALKLAVAKAVRR